MAKKKEKTLEEKLQEALVPENQWPYILPENWCWTKGKYILEKMESQKPEGDYFYYIDIDAIDNSCQIVTEPKQIAVCDAPSRASRKLHVGDTIFSLVRPYLKNIAYIDKSLSNSIASTGFYVCTPKKNVFPKFFYWLMISPYVVDGLNKYMKGDNSPSIRGGDIEGFCYPIPPLPEQKRIVYRIESLFAKLDEAKEKIQQVLDGAEMRKAAILHKAFTGELTKNWRKENGISEDSWVEYTLQSVCTMKITDGTHKTPTYSDKENGVVFLSAKDITSGEINWENTKYITSELHKELYSRLAPQINDILLAKNGTTGVAALVKEDKVFDIYVTLALLRPNVEIVIPEYLLNIINSPLCKVQFNENLTGIGVPNLHLRDIKDVKIKVPSISEQEIISDKVEMLLANEGMVTKNCLKQIEVIDTMKKSILAKAFRGELGKNNPTEDSALNLLKEVLQDKS